ncbi:hypothetical protein [Mesorhizobium sp. B2-4-15]|uniref:hypothetical protein n=1 Tax=Mesorhizobium sp. B2-4-15 TaxID=2589934 RepID=UPI0015EEBAF4|nr:hypothetical protein [Mesorhizobium sp. B2-4-15]
MPARRLLDGWRLLRPWLRLRLPVHRLHLLLRRPWLCLRLPVHILHLLLRLSAFWSIRISGHHG